MSTSAVPAPSALARVSVTISSISASSSAALSSAPNSAAISSTLARLEAIVSAVSGSPAITWSEILANSGSIARVRLPNRMRSGPSSAITSIFGSLRLPMSVYSSLA